jgi:hypothetical protein
MFVVMTAIWVATRKKKPEPTATGIRRLPIPGR